VREKLYQALGTGGLSGLISSSRSRSQAPAWERTVLEALPPLSARQSLAVVGSQAGAWELEVEEP